MAEGALPVEACRVRPSALDEAGQAGSTAEAARRSEGAEQRQDALPVRCAPRAEGEWKQYPPVFRPV
jgi:hypothetical protein